VKPTWGGGAEKKEENLKLGEKNRGRGGKKKA